jgi:hypothetical protein
MSAAFTPVGTLQLHVVAEVKVRTVNPPLELLVGEQDGKDVAEAVALPPE